MVLAGEMADQAATETAPTSAPEVTPEQAPEQSPVNGKSAEITSDVLDPAELEALKKDLAEQEAKENARLLELENMCSREIENRMESINSQVNTSFEQRMSDFEKRYHSHAHDSINLMQTDVLRVNKIIREVSRGLGCEWKPVFMKLMKNCPQEELDKEVERIEAQKPFIQSYKALNSWRDAMGDEFHVQDLVAALNASDEADLANVVMDVVDCNDADSLYRLERFGKDKEGAQNGSGIGGVQRRPSMNRKASQDSRKSSLLDDMEGPLGDRKFLKVARKLGPAWVDLGKTLEVPEEEMEEIRASEEGYQAAFKLLWNWRDAVGLENEMENAQKLTKALTDIGKADLVQFIIPPEEEKTS